MTIANSKKLLVVEIVLFLAPTTGLGLYSTILLAESLISKIPGYGKASTLGAIVIISLSLISVWILAITFIKGNADSLGEKNGFIWSFLFIGVLYTLIGFIVFIIYMLGHHEILLLISMFQLGAFGILALIPAIPLFLESRRQIVIE